jgi:hypothetical protein
MNSQYDAYMCRKPAEKYKVEIRPIIIMPRTPPANPQMAECQKMKKGSASLSDYLRGAWFSIF